MAHVYATVLYDHTRKSVIHMLQGRDRKSVYAFFKAQGKEWCESVKVVTCDLWRVYKSAVRKFLPNATVVTDKFHVFKYAGDALEELRRSEYNRQADKVMDLDLILESYRELHPDTELKDVWMFFDELPLVEGWKLFILRVYKSYCKHIFICGSNAHTLSKEMKSELRVWPLEFETWPLPAHLQLLRRLRRSACRSRDRLVPGGAAAEAGRPGRERGVDAYGSEDPGEGSEVSRPVLLHAA